MAAKTIKPSRASQLWWENAYDGLVSIRAEYEYTLGKDTIKPGDKIRIKNDRNIYMFRCYASNVVTDSHWIDCIGPNGDWRSFRIDKIKCLVKPKKARARKVKSETI